MQGTCPIDVSRDLGTRFGGANLACDGHRKAAENGALAKEKYYRLIPILLNA